MTEKIVRDEVKRLLLGKEGGSIGGRRYGGIITGGTTTGGRRRRRRMGGYKKGTKLTSEQKHALAVKRAMRGPKRLSNWNAFVKFAYFDESFLDDMKGMTFKERANFLASEYDPEVNWIKEVLDLGLAYPEDMAPFNPPSKRKKRTKK